MVQYLQQFSRTVDFQDLSDIFHKDGELDHAAVRCHTQSLCVLCACCMVQPAVGLSRHIEIH